MKSEKDHHVINFIEKGVLSDIVVRLALSYETKEQTACEEFRRET